MISHVKPYIELARLDKPAGFLLLMWPCFWGVILAGDSNSINYYFLFLFFIGSVALRGAGCVVNDIVDRKIDAQVERTKDRPLASGRLKVWNAICLLVFLLSAGFFVWMQLNTQAKLYSVGAAALACIYPFMKRIFNYPQLFLGIVFNSGVLVGYVAIKGELDFDAGGLSAIIMYIGGIFWTLGYDTIYGHQDIKDDKKIGVKSTAIAFGKHNYTLIFTFFFLTYLCIALAAHRNGDVTAHITLLPAIIHMILLVKKMDLKKPADCLKKFKSIAFITGFLLTLGLYSAKFL